MEATEELPAGRVLVTGASSGIGAAFAERLARDGHDLIVVARRVARLTALAERVRQQHGVIVEVLAADLARPDDVRAVEQRLASMPDLALLVNNAGFHNHTPFHQLDVDATEELIRVHVLALVRLTRAALPGLIARGRGAIINVSSIAPFDTGSSPEWTTYRAAKSYVNAFTQGLHGELQGTGVRVQALCPGWVRTEILERAGLPWTIPAEATMSPETLVNVALTGLHLGEVICVPGLDDPDLLTQIDALQGAVRDRAAATGRPAARYGVTNTTS
jgi:short-subunit dehydrogenase